VPDFDFLSDFFFNLFSAEKKSTEWNILLAGTGVFFFLRVGGFSEVFFFKFVEACCV
jgi:hypothetical protein